ncbi:MAG: hypothetical protein JWN46_1819 [Acidimicrobiales bacterium]|nr:hypothetical protein [Acidimicrobiales bacterium]
MDWSKTRPLALITRNAPTTGIASGAPCEQISTTVPDLGHWPARVVWLVLPFTAGPALAAALDPRSAPIRLTASTLLWVGWAVTLGATLVPRSVSLTVVRTLAPAALVAAIWATLARDHVSTAGVVAIATTALALGAIFLPTTGEAFVDGSSYGPERRMTLRTPSGLLLGPVPLTWTVVVGGIVAGPLLLAGRQWAAGAVAVVVGVPAAALGVRSLHQLARRWVVFVPAGLVLHDPLALPEPHLFLRSSIRWLGPAAAGTDAIDLTGGAAGLALELELFEPLDLLRRTGRGATATEPATHLLFTPVRPAALLDEARSRRITVR